MVVGEHDLSNRTSSHDFTYADGRHVAGTVDCLASLCGIKREVKIFDQYLLVDDLGNGGLYELKIGFTDHSHGAFREAPLAVSSH